MLYHELVNTIKEICEPVEIGTETGHLAVQFNVSGFGEGAFYLEIKDGRVEVMPYEYHDRDLLFFLPTEVVIALFEGKVELELALDDGSIGYEGDREKVRILVELIRHANGGDAAIQEKWNELNGQVKEAVTGMIESSEASQDGDAVISETDALNQEGGAVISEVESVGQDGSETVSKEETVDQNGTAGSSEEGTVDQDGTAGSSEERTVDRNGTAGSSEERTANELGSAEQDDTAVEPEVKAASKGDSVRAQELAEVGTVGTGASAGIGNLSEELSVKQDGISSKENQVNKSENSPVQGRSAVEKRSLSGHKKKLEKKLEKKAKALKIKAARKKDVRKKK